MTSLVAVAATAENNCRPSKWGKNDEIGAANLITQQSVLQAAKLIKRGKVQQLGMIIDKDTPAFGARSLSLQIVQPGHEFGRQPFPNGFNYNDDVFQGWFGIGSQLDGLSHVGHHGVFYNCFDGKDFVHITGVTKMGIEKVPPFATRGVILDMAAHFGVDYMKGGQFFSVEDVKAVEKKQGTPVHEGDVVLFYTGWTDHMYEKDPQVWGSQEPGISEEVAHYLAAKNVVAVGADTWGVDVVPPQNKGNIFAGHLILMKENGIYILENIQSGSLVRDKAYEVLFVLGPHRVRGSVQAMINPVAIY